MKKILISAFEPFDGMDMNPSQQLIENLVETDFLKTCLLPVSFQRAFSGLKAHLDNWNPDFVICLGVARNRSVITLEKVAINWIETKIADNDGDMPKGSHIYPGEDLAYFSSLPLNKMQAATLGDSFPAEISYTAGTYVCNQVMYLLLREIKGSSIQGGFIHIPMIKEMEKESKMDFEQVLRQFKKIVELLGSSSR